MTFSFFWTTWRRSLVHTASMLWCVEKGSRFDTNHDSIVCKCLPHRSENAMVFRTVQRWIASSRRSIVALCEDWPNDGTFMSFFYCVNVDLVCTWIHTFAELASPEGLSSATTLVMVREVRIYGFHFGKCCRTHNSWNSHFYHIFEDWLRLHIFVSSTL